MNYQSALFKHVNFVTFKPFSKKRFKQRIRKALLPIYGIVNSLSPKRKYVFLHVYAPQDVPIEHWQSVFRECFSALLYSGLYQACDKVVVGLNCPNGYGEQFLKDYLSTFDKVTIGAVVHVQHAVEWTTLKLVHEMAGEYDYCLYIHCKNASRKPDDKNFFTNERWRIFMLTQCVRDWRKCIKFLHKGYDLVGCSWKFKTHFQGNFWWAQSRHIKNLPHPDALFNDVALREKLLKKRTLQEMMKKELATWVKEDWEIESMRYVAEAWTYLSKPRPRYFELTPGLNLLKGKYDLKDYL